MSLWMNHKASKRLTEVFLASVPRAGKTPVCLGCGCSKGIWAAAQMEQVSTAGLAWSLLATFPPSCR